MRHFLRNAHMVADFWKQKLTLEWKSGQEVAKQVDGLMGKFFLQEGAGSRIRTDDLLITNQLL